MSEMEYRTDEMTKNIARDGKYEHGIKRIDCQQCKFH